MNEHIEAYLKQHYCRDYFNSYGETVEDDHYFMYREEVDGLIELIVFECTNAVMDGTKEGDHYAQRIEQHFDNGTGGLLHFGVEE